MIVAPLSRLAAIPDVPSAIREAAALLADLAAGRGFEEGASTLDGWTMTVTTAPVRASRDTPFEAHRRFIDLHYVIQGTEGYGAAAIAALTPRTPYAAQEDTELFEPATTALHPLVLEAGWAVVFFPEDGHRARCAVAGVQGPGDTPRLVRKAVVKIAVEATGSRGRP